MSGWETVFASNVLALAATACGTVWLAAVRADDLLLPLGGHHSDMVLPVNVHVAALSGVAASAMLILLFYFFHMLSWLLLASALFSGVMTLFLLGAPVVAALLAAVRAPSAVVVPHAGTVRIAPAVSTLLGCVVAATWAWTGSWLLNNVLGVALAVLMVAVGRLPSLRVAVLLLGCLLLYDVFWVYLSHNFFGENVMTAVASRETANPIAKLAEAMAITPPPSLVQHLQLPAKLVFPSWDGRSIVMLGLGDIALPGMLLAMYHRVVVTVAGTPRRLYFTSALLGYALGLEITLVAAFVYDAAQPALLFLVPCITVPVAGIALWRGEFARLWHGPAVFGEDQSTSSSSSHTDVVKSV